MKKQLSNLIILFFILFITPIRALEFSSSSHLPQSEIDMPPKYLYKVLLPKDWEESKNLPNVKLGSFDREFIHLSTEEQLNKIIEKYFKDEKMVIILKIETDKLPGNLIFEANPGGSTKYYHLYQGSIPKEAIIETKEL